jgi:hypothetical protein
VVNLGVRRDLQTFTTVGLISNPLFPPSGKVPFKPYNFGPRAGLAYSIGKTHPLVIRAGYGIFYVRIPSDLQLRHRHRQRHHRRSSLSE